MATETIEVYKDGALIATEQVTVPDEVVTERTLRTQARQALAANKTFTALASPTNAQVVDQVKALTKQNNGLIRLVLGDLDAAD